MLWGYFSAAGTEGLIRVEEKLNAPKYWVLMKTQSRAFRTSDWAEGSPSNRTMNPNYTARVAYRQLCGCPWVAQPQPGIKPSQIFLEKPENVCLPQSNLTELERWRGEGKIGKWWCAKLVTSYPKILEAVKVLQLSIELRDWILMQCTHFRFLICNKFTKLWQFCFCFVIMVYGL